MIKCDLCGNEETADNINTLILHKKKIDYCNRKKCNKKILEIVTLWKRIQLCNYLEYERGLKKEEKEFIEKLRRKGIMQ